VAAAAALYVHTAARQWSETHCSPRVHARPSMQRPQSPPQLPTHSLGISAGAATIDPAVCPVAAAASSALIGGHEGCVYGRDAGEHGGDGECVRVGLNIRNSCSSAYTAGGVNPGVKVFTIDKIKVPVRYQPLLNHAT
jgi:hypothetical protein